ncbi:MAG: extensin family protein [Pseudomonadota bacterium]
MRALIAALFTALLMLAADPLPVLATEANPENEDRLSELLFPVPRVKPGQDEEGDIPAPSVPARKEGSQSSAGRGTASAPPPIFKTSQRQACPVLLTGQVRGRYLASIATAEGCGDDAPVEISEVSGIRIAPPVTLNCRMAVAFVDWVEKVTATSRALFDANLATIRTAASYQCRRRNNKPDGKFSEHATMNAVDISGFVLENALEVSVGEDWPSATETDASNARLARLARRLAHPSTSKQRFLRTVHASACTAFTTVLGPDADDAHAAHFHFDLGCHGAACTFRICQ